MNRTLIVIALLVCLLPASAQAESYGPGQPFGSQEEAAFAAAEGYWGQTPALCTSLSKEVVPVGALNGPGIPYEVVGRASQPSVPTACGIWIQEGLPSGELCQVMRHEYGHLLGLGHTETGIMAATPEPAAAPDCYAAGSAPIEARRRIWAKWRRVRTSCPQKPTRQLRQRCYLRALAINQEASEQVNRGA